VSTLQARADVKVGFACNNRCVFCAQGEKRGECGLIHPAELTERLKSVRAPGRGLVFTGGEPTLHKHLITLIRIARQVGFSPIQIQTNGRLLSYKSVVRALVEAGAEELSPSIHGSTAVIHDALTRADGSWDESMCGIRNAVESGARVVTNSVITRANATDLPTLVDLLGTLGVTNAQLAFVHPVGTAESMFDEVVPRLPEVVEPVRQSRDIARAAGMRFVTEGIPYCFLRGMEEVAVEDDIPHTTVVDLDGHVADYSAWREVEGKSHGPQCEGCSRRKQCEGPWREYPAKFGWDEFVPFPADEPR
jgi:MoaA/NifB/PqqE/SkfB family radical SAM enzyme